LHLQSCTILVFFLFLYFRNPYVKEALDHHQKKRDANEEKRLAHMGDAKMGPGTHENPCGWLGTRDEHGVYGTLSARCWNDRPRACAFSASASGSAGDSEGKKRTSRFSKTFIAKFKAE
jgi:hypothetical protein